jgi:hypothetical protein
VTFDREQIEEAVALNRIHPIQKLAWDALEADLDGPNIRRLAALENPSPLEVDELLPKVLREMGMRHLPKPEAAERAACRVATRVLETDSDPLLYVNEFYGLWVRVAGDCSPELTAFGCLKEEVFVAKSFDRPDDEIRTWLRENLRELVQACKSR